MFLFKPYIKIYVRMKKLFVHQISLTVEMYFFPSTSFFLIKCTLCIFRRAVSKLFYFSSLNYHMMIPLLSEASIHMFNLYFVLIALFSQYSVHVCRYTRKLNNISFFSVKEEYIHLTKQSPSSYYCNVNYCI